MNINYTKTRDGLAHDIHKLSNGIAWDDAVQIAESTLQNFIKSLPHPATVTLEAGEFTKIAAEYYIDLLELRI